MAPSWAIWLIAFDELFSLHGIYLAHSGKMLRCEGRNTLQMSNFLSGSTQIVSPIEKIPGSNTPMISPAYASVHDLAFLSHHLLRLGQTHLLAALHMVNFHTGIKLAGNRYA